MQTHHLVHPMENSLEFSQESKCRIEHLVWYELYLSIWVSKFIAATGRIHIWVIIRVISWIAF